MPIFFIISVLLILVLFFVHAKIKYLAKINVLVFLALLLSRGFYMST